MIPKEKIYPNLAQTVVSVDSTEYPQKALETPLICEIASDKNDEMCSILSISNDLPHPKKKILLSMEVITEEKIKEIGDSFNSSNRKEPTKFHKFIDSEESPICPVSSQIEDTPKLELPQKMEPKIQPNKKNSKGTLISNKRKKTNDLKKKSHKNQEVCKNSISLKNINTQQKNEMEFTNPKLQGKCRKGGSKQDIKESEYALSFSSGTNLTQTSFDFGFSKVTSCECSMVNKNGGSNQCMFNKKKPKQNQPKVSSLNNLENGKIINNKKKENKRTSKSKKKTKKNSQITKKCCNCGKKSYASNKKKSNLEIPNFIVQPFNKYETILEKRNYESDTRGTLGKLLIQ